jgi:hypothetical protein
LVSPFGRSCGTKTCREYREKLNENKCELTE